MFEVLENRVLLAVDVTIDGSTRYQTMDGFGSSLRVFDDPHVFENFNPATGKAATVLTPTQQGEVMDRLYRDLELTRVRPVIEGSIETVNDNSDPNVTDLSKFNFEWKRLDADVDYLAAARDRGASTFFPSPLVRERWMGASTAADVAEYGEWLMAQVRRSAERGVRLPYLAVANEPSGGGNPLSGAFIRDVIKNVGPRLRADGFDTLFVTPDDIRASDAAAKAAVILADPAARQYVGALGTHLYDESVSNVGQMKALAQQYQLPLWMTEFSTSGMPSAGRPANAFAWASLMHDLISTYDVSAVDYMWGFFGEWDRAQLITLNHTGATYDGYTLNKVYYTTGQFSRFVEPGAERIGAQSSDGTVQTTAFLNDDGELVIVAINNGSANQTTTFNLSGLNGFRGFDATRTSGTENWATLTPIAVDRSTFSTILPHNSITTFTADAPAAVVGRHVFYNDSFADGDDGAANAADDAAIATGKSALLPRQTASFANVTSYTRGINGVMIDIAALPEGIALTADDFSFRTGSTGDPATWASGPRPAVVAVRRGEGTRGSDRITLTWPDYDPASGVTNVAVGNGWLEVTVDANERTGLTSPVVFSFGNLVGETGDNESNLAVNALDIAAVKRALNRPTDVTTPVDFNRDGRVNALDLAVVKRNLNGRLPLPEEVLPASEPLAVQVISLPGSSFVIEGGVDRKRRLITLVLG